LILIKAVPRPFVVIQALALPIQIFRSEHDDSCYRGEEQAASRASSRQGA
jgi:hypothetical protein